MRSDSSDLGLAADAKSFRDFDDRAQSIILVRDVKLVDERCVSPFPATFFGGWAAAPKSGKAI